MKTFRIIVVGGSDTGKTAFIDSLGAVATGGSTSTNKKSVTVKNGDDLIKFDFVELPSDKFEESFLKRSEKLPSEFEGGHGVAMLFSYADHHLREPCTYWLRFLSNQEQGDGMKPTIVIIGNKADLIVAGSPQANFVSQFSYGDIINVDSRIMADDHDVHLSPMRVLARFGEEMLEPNQNVDFLVPVMPAPLVGLLIPTKESKTLLKTVVLHQGQPVVLGREEIHTGFTGTKDSRAMLQSISRRHIEVVYQPNGTTILTKLSDCVVSILNPNARCIQIIRTKNKVVEVPVNGMINLNHGTDQVTYKVRSFHSFVTGTAAERSGSLSISNLLHEHDLNFKKHAKLLEAELVRSSQKIEMLEKLVSLRSEKIDEELERLTLIAEDDDNSDDSEIDIYAGETQAY